MNANIAWVDSVDGEFEFTETWAKFTEIAGLTIKHVRMDGEQLVIEFNERRFHEHRTLVIADDRQSCCERRYMTCDDDLSGHEGGHLVGINTDAADPKPVLDYAGEKADDDYDECHEVQFVKVQTTKGSFTLCTHNEHNGYYGGFSIEVKLGR